MKTADDSALSWATLTSGFFESLTVLWRRTVSGVCAASESYFCYSL